MDKKNYCSGSASRVGVSEKNLTINFSHQLIRRIYIPAMLLLVSMLLAAIVSAGPPGPGKMPPPMVAIATVIEKNVNPPREFVGRMEAIRSVELRARVQGYLEEIRFKEGTHVQAGDILYIIEQAPYRVQVNVDRARVAQAKATLNKAQQYLKRLQAASSGAVSATDIETAASNEIQARAALQEAEAILEQSMLNLSYTSVKAPINGTIGRTAYTEGNLVGPSSGPLARIVQMTPVRAVFSISENELSDVLRRRLTTSLNELKEFRIVRLRLPNGEIYPLEGRPDFIDNEVDRTTGTIALRIVFDNPEGFLVPGQYVTLLISMSSPKKMPVVPQSAVLEDRDGRYVFVLGQDKMVELRRIKTGAELETEWAVKRGLRVGEHIIVEGIQKVRPGQPVRPMNADYTKGGAPK